MTRCQKCAYWSRGYKVCDYLTIVGHSRGSPPGDACTVFKSAESVKRKKIGLSLRPRK